VASLKPQTPAQHASAYALAKFEAQGSQYAGDIGDGKDSTTVANLDSESSCF